MNEPFPDRNSVWTPSFLSNTVDEAAGPPTPAETKSCMSVVGNHPALLRRFPPYITYPTRYGNVNAIL